MARIMLLALASTALAAKDPATTVVNEWPMIMVHDAATSYLKGGTLHQINDWAKTQVDGGAQGELNCGARAFDWRPSLGSGMRPGGLYALWPCAPVATTQDRQS